MARQITPENKYTDRLLKLVPAEIVAAFLAIKSAIPPNTANTETASMVVFFVLLVLVPFYLTLLLKVHSKLQIAVSMISFVIWAFSMGGLSAFFPNWEDYYNSIIIILWAVAFPLLKYDPPSPRKVAPNV